MGFDFTLSPLILFSNLTYDNCNQLLVTLYFLSKNFSSVFLVFVQNVT
jgi:hypothetical protein